MTVVICFVAFCLLALYLGKGLEDRVDHYRIQENDIEVKKTYENLLEAERSKLHAVLAPLVEIKVLRDDFAARDRAKLLADASPVFEKLKAASVTHWYFHLPDGTVFLRVHEPGLFGDVVARSSLGRASSTLGLVDSIELGKTAYAIRATMPYYGSDGRLLGFIEIGEDLDVLTQTLQRQTGTEIATFALKDGLDRRSLEGVFKEKGRLLQWDRYPDFVQLNASPGFDLLPCSSAEALREANAEPGTYVDPRRPMEHCLSFQLRDFRDKTIGIVIIGGNMRGLDDYFTPFMQFIILGSLLFLLPPLILILLLNPEADGSPIPQEPAARL